VGGDAGGEQVRLAGLHARPDPQLGEALAALLELGEVALDVDGQVPGGVPVDQPVGGRAVLRRPVVKSRCSVKAMAGGPRATPARRRAHRGGVGGPRTTRCARGCPAVHRCGLSPRPQDRRGCVRSPAAAYCRPMSTPAPTELPRARSPRGAPRADRPARRRVPRGQDAAVAALVERSQRALSCSAPAGGSRRSTSSPPRCCARVAPGPTPVSGQPAAWRLMRDQGRRRRARRHPRRRDLQRQRHRVGRRRRRLAADDVDVLLVSPSG
jgi:hypothetical protein